MLSEKKRKAVELLFECLEGDVLTKLRLSKQMLDTWSEDWEFKDAIAAQVKSNRRTAVRLLSKLYLDAVLELREIITEKEDKNRHKVIVDVLKASGLLIPGSMEDELDSNPHKTMKKRLDAYYAGEKAEKVNQSPVLSDQLSVISDQSLEASDQLSVISEQSQEASEQSSIRQAQDGSVVSDQPEEVKGMLPLDHVPQYDEFGRDCSPEAMGAIEPNRDNAQIKGRDQGIW